MTELRLTMSEEPYQKTNQMYGSENDAKSEKKIYVIF